MEPENKTDKQALRDKNRISAKEFIKMKRGQAKEEKNSSESFDLARNFITNNEVAKLEEFLMSSKPPFALTFFFSEDQLKQTPLINILQAEGVLSLLQVVNRWSAGNSDLIVREIYMEDNQFKSNHFRGKFQAVNKFAMEAVDRYVTAGRATKQLIMLLGEKDGLFYHLCKNFLTLQMVISTVCSLKTKNDLLAHYYMPLLTFSPLSELTQLTEKVRGYQDVLMRDRFWSRGDSSIIKEISLENIRLMTLKELNYNIWHHFAHISPKELRRFAQLVIALEEQELKEKYWELLGEVDSSGETVTDICLKTWTFDQITDLLALNKKIDAILLSTACLNKLFYNRKLKQSQREALINECLQGEISEKGYINVISNTRKKQCRIKGKIIVLERKPVKYTFNISFNKDEVKRHRDNAGSYPLVTYLRLYKQSASLKTVQQLYLQFLNRKEIKKKLQILMKSTEEKRITLENKSPKYQEIQGIIFYYQSLWKVITWMPHTDVLEFLVSKTYLNCFEIKMFPSNKKAQAELFGKHFLTDYFNNNPFLGQDAVNRQILQGIVNVKQTERKVGGNDFCLELARSLVNHDHFLQSQEYLALGIKSYLNQQLMLLPSEQLQIISYAKPHEPLLDIISSQLAYGKASLLSKQQVLQKYNTDKLIEDYKTQFRYLKGQEQSLKKYYQQILKDHGIVLDDDEQGEDFDWLNQKEVKTYHKLQNVYFQHYGKDYKNKIFFDNIHAWLKVSSTTFLKEELARKYWSFRLRANQKHLRYKFQRLLELGFDPYFSKYSKADFKFKEEQPQWNRIMSKMLKEKKTFLGALITSTSKIDPFATIFERNFSRQNCDLKLYKKITQWGRYYEKNLYEKIDEGDFQKISRLQINQTPYFVEESCRNYNLELIVNILNIALKHGLSQNIFFANVRYFFQRCIIQNVSLITQHQRKQKISKSEDKVAISQKIVQLEKNAEVFIDKWITQLTKMHSSSQQDQQKLHQYLIRLIIYAKNLQCSPIANFILKHIVFERISQTKLVVDKLQSSKDADEILNAFLSTLSDDALSTWISRTIYSEKTRITTIAKTFSFEAQINILLPLMNRIQSHQDIIIHAKVRQVALVSEKIVSWTKVLVKMILQSVARDNIVKLIKTIDDVINIDYHLSAKTKNQYYCFLLSTTDDVQLIALALLVTNVEYFYLKQSTQQKAKRFHVKTFFVKCKQESYIKYLKVLEEYHSLAKYIESHLKVAIISLIQAQKWSRLGQLLNIKALQNIMVPLIFKALYQTFNKQQRQCDAQVTTIVNQIFTYLQTEKTQFNEDLFVAAFSLDYQRAFKVFKPKNLSIYGFRRCIPNNPECATLFLSNKVILNLNYLPSDISQVQTKRLKYWFPMIPHSNDRISANKWLIDELRFQLLLTNDLKAQRFMIKTLKALCTSEEVLVHKAEIYERVLSDKAICEHLLRCRQLKSLANYEKSLPDLKKMIKQELFGSPLTNKKGRCMNLNILNPMLLRDFITSKELSSNEPINMSSCFLRIVETANLYLIELFITTNKITINYEYLKTVQQYFGFSFWDHLLGICNQDFIIAFVNKYKLFEIYSPEEYSQKLLNTICRFRYNKLLEFVIKYFEGKAGSKAIFAAETIQNKPNISKNAIFYLPIELSIQNCFYQIYFLIQSSGNQCPKFPLSGRFLSYMKPQEWNYIPQFKRRVEINNTFMETLREAQEMDFRFKVLLPSIFELQTPTEPLPQQVGQENLRQKPKKNSEYLAKFIHDITKKCLRLNNQSGVFEKLCFMLFKKEETKIPEAQLEKKYPAQMKLINKIRKFIDKSNVDLTLWQLFDYVPQFKSHLLVYNPSTFLENQEYLQQIMGIGDKKLDFSEYLKGIEVNFIEFQQKYPHVLQNYIKEYFFNSSVRLGSPKASLHLTREALLLIFLDISHHQRRWQHCSILKLCQASQRFEQINYQQMQTQMEPERSPQEVIYDIAMCLNTRGKKAMNFDLMTWNKMIQEIQEIQEFWKKMGKGITLKQYSFNPQEIDKIASNYAHIAQNRKNKYRIVNWKDILCEIYYQQVKNCSKKGVFIEISFILNMFLIANDLKVLEQKIQSIKGGSNIQQINVKLVRNVTNPIMFQPATYGSYAQISIEVPFSIQKHESKQVSLFMIDDTNIITNIQHFAYLSSLQSSPSINQLNHYCSHLDRHPFLKNYRFRYTVQSLKNIKYESLTNILEHGIMKNDGAVGKIIYELQKMEERLIGTKNIKVYSHSDIFGPINFSEQLDDEKIIDCLGFYELIDLPKEEQIKVTYVDKEFSSQQKNQLALRQIRDYLKFYISVSKDQNTAKMDLSSQIFVSVKKYKNEQRVQLDWWMFGGWTVCEVYCLAMNYCSDLSSKIDKILDVRVSFASLINYYEKYLECGNELSIKIALEKFLFQKHFNRFVKSIILMITQDVGNIMKIVKGIIIKWSINKKDAKRKGIIKISQFTNAISVEYGIKDQILSIIINLQMRKGLNKTQELNENNEDYHALVDRKQFLDSVFTSAQFLTDYFILRNQLNNECLRISTSITSKLNSTVNFYIEYSNLYAYVEKMRNEKQIKVIESFLIRLKQYLSNSMDKTIHLYLNSQELANRHQVFILNKCQAINKGLPFKTVEQQKELVYDSLETDPASGLTQIISLMNQIGNDQNIKNVFLIQIYKSYYTTMVGQGMTFVVGYKSNKKKAQVIKITKAENINLINIVELDFIMLVSKNIPTNDQLNQSKIIRIFITDSNKNLYQLNEKIKQYFLALPQENQQRNLSYFAPLIPSNVMLKFAIQGKKEEDIKDTKVFFVDLNESQKFKLVPSFDKPLSPLNSCKKNLEFKQAISDLQKGFRNFTQSSVKFIIDLPQEYAQKYIGTNFSHIVHLVSTDLLQFLLKFQFEPMRNETLDCKLSIENGFILNKNSIIELRKRSFMKHYNRLRIRIRDTAPGISFSQKQVSIAIDVSNMTTLPSCTEYLSTIVDNILKNEKKELPQFVTFGHADKNESTQVLLKELDIINSIPFQIQEIKEAIQLIQLVYKAKVNPFQIIIHNKKTEIKFDKGIEIYLSTGSVQREFFSAQDIFRSYIGFLHKNFEPNAKGQTHFNPLQQKIMMEEIASENIKIIYKNLQQCWISQDFRNFSQNSQYKLQSKYYLIQSNNIYSNYFFEVDKQLAIKEKDAQGTRCKSKNLYLQSSKAINLNFTNISIAETSPLFKQSTSSFNILRSPLDKNKITIQLLSKNMYFLAINYEQSMILNVNYAGNTNIFKPQLDSTRLVISSDGQLYLDNTKFLQLQAYKKKPVLIKDKQYQVKNSQFRESNQLASEKELQLKLGDFNNIENLVYVVNDECKRFLTRAGEPRVDFIQLCDNDGNPIDYKAKLQVMFVHINKLAIVRPEIIPRNMQLGLKWTPTIRGHYYLYINNVRINPPYEIGVCAAQADYKTTIVTLPKIKKICYCQETQLMMDLRDSFGNLYTQLQEDILGDSLLIELKCSHLNEVLKVEKSQINKYGLKKVKFSFNNIEQQKATDIQVVVFLNCEEISKFVLTMEGLSLKQRKKLLDKDISLSSKNYYKDISINRNRFLQDLFVIAEKSLHTNLSVRFANEPGIDAGGVKREFYDMIGNEIKSERNPFFKMINPNTMEYFLNPEILRNKKKLEYMQLWGKYLANSFLNSYLIGVSFSPVFVKLLYEQSIDYEDLLSVLPQEERKQYEYLLTASAEDFEDLDLYFTVIVDKKKCIQVELKQGGKDIRVTPQNVKEYLEYTAQILLTERYKEIMIAFRKGFETVLQLKIFKKWIRYSEFWCLTTGNKEITPELVLNYIVFQGSAIDNISGWFRRFISEANHEVLVGFLKFSSGSSSIDFSLASKVTVTFENAGENPKKLPISHTCWKEIVVPKYKNYDIMKKLLTAAFIYCSEGFGFG